jgi:cysteine-rich repeat protein
MGTVLMLAAIGAPRSAAAVKWALQQTLTSPEPGGAFGDTVAAVGDNWLVGQPGQRAYLFDGTTGAVLLAFTNPIPSTNAGVQYAESVAAYGNDLLIGDPSRDAVYLHDGATGALLRTILNPTPAPPNGFGLSSEDFGSSVAAQPPNVAVGDPLDGRWGDIAGAAYLIDPFGSANGALIFDLPNTAPSFRGGYGHRMAFLGDDVLVGVPGNATFGPDRNGRVYLLSGATGEILRVFTPPPPTLVFGQQFGYDVAPAGPNILIGARGGDGNAYLFTPNGFLLQSFPDPDTSPTTFSAFGEAVGPMGDQVIVGAPFGGRVHLFDSASGALLQSIELPVMGAMTIAVNGDRFAVGGGQAVRIYGPCGDGVQQPGEQCEDGNDVSGDGCDENCTPTACGNGVVTAGETCDDGNVFPGDGCRANCTVEVCGDGTQDPQEQCDDGNTVSGDGCDANCRPTGCGNQLVTGVEQCDDGAASDITCCSPTCTFDPPETGCLAGSGFGRCDGAGNCVPEAIPTLSEWGVLAVASLMLLVMLQRVRRLQR